MDIFAFVFIRLIYSISVATALNQYIGSKLKSLYYFLFVFLVMLLLNDYLFLYSMPITVIIVTGFMFVTKKKKLYDALFIATNAITWIIICIFLCIIIPMLFFPASVGTTVYDIIIGILQFTTIALISPYTTKRFTDIPHSKRIKRLSIMMQSIFILVYGAIVPLVADKPFLTVYAVFGIFAVLLMTYIHYAVGYMATTDIEQRVREKELTTTKTLYKNMSDAFDKAMIDNHYSTGLAKTIAAHLDNNDLHGLKEYFYSKVEPFMNIEITKIDTLKNIHDELIRNLIYLTQKRANGLNIPMDVEIEGIIIDFYMDSFDLFKVLNIYFDNAIDASKLCENPFITLKIRNNQNSVSIELSNIFNIENPVAIKTSNRGHGLKIADGYIMKYDNVTTNTFVEGNIFAQKLVIGGCVVSKITDKFTDILAKPRNLKKTDDEYLILKYGVERLFADIYKTVLVSAIAVFLGIWQEFLIIFCLYFLLRTFGCGIHLDNDFLCAAEGTVMYIGGIYLAKAITIPLQALLILFPILFVLYFLYAPAGTKYQPIGKSKKKKHKIISLALLTLFFILAVTLGEGTVGNLIAIASTAQCLNILPITYYILKKGRADDYEKS